MYVEMVGIKQHNLDVQRVPYQKRISVRPARFASPQPPHLLINGEGGMGAAWG